MKKIIILLLAMLSVTGIRAQMIAAHTDLGLLALQTYSLGAEMTINNRSTLLLDGVYSKDPYWHKGMDVLAIQPELRYYFGGRPMYHHFIGLSAVGAKYDITWDDKRHKGIAAGAGLNLGYAFALSKRVTIDAHTGIGILATHEHLNGGPSKWGYRIVPTKIGVTLSYIIR